MDVQIKIRIRSKWLKRRLVRLLDWWWSDKEAIFGFPYRLLPVWPIPACGHITQHKEELRWSSGSRCRWADYMSDCGGIRCRCRLRHEDYTQ